MKIIKESEQLDKKVTWLRKKIFNLDRLGERERYDTRITDQGIYDTIENHLLRYKDELAHIYDDPQYLDEELFQSIKSGIANKEKSMKFLRLTESAKGKNRIVWDDCIATAERRRITADDIEEGIHVKQYKNAEELLKELLYLAGMDEEELETDNLTDNVKEILESLSDVSDGSPIILYISVNGEEFDDYVYPYDELDSLNLATCSEKAIKKALLDEYDFEDEDDFDDDEDIEE